MNHHKPYPRSVEHTRPSRFENVTYIAQVIIPHARQKCLTVQDKTLPHKTKGVTSGQINGQQTGALMFLSNLKLNSRAAAGLKLTPPSTAVINLLLAEPPCWFISSM